MNVIKNALIANSTNLIIANTVTYLPKIYSNLNLWEEVHVDMIGPWKITINQFEYQFKAVTCIDAVVNLPEVIPVDNARSTTVANAIEDN